MPPTDPCSSPFILDLDMQENIDDGDFDFFGPSTPYAESASPGGFPGYNLPAEDKGLVGLASPPASQKRGFGGAGLFVQSSPQALPARTLDSPGGSLHGSSSASSTYKRTPSPASSRSEYIAKEASMNDAEMGDWKAEERLNGDDTGGYDDAYASAGALSTDAIASLFTDEAMENVFDFDSAASSPDDIARSMKSPEMPIIKCDALDGSAPSPSPTANHQLDVSRNPVSPSMHAAREASPLSTMVTNQEPSPPIQANKSPSPTNGMEFINETTILGGAAQNNPWSANYEFGMHSPRAANAPFITAAVNNTPPAIPYYTDTASVGNVYKPKLTIHPTPLKSRVETQIPIKMTLFPLPPGVTKLHLPTHTISKPKLLARPPPAKSADMLELSTTLVCTSAMQNPEISSRVLARAAGTLATSESRPDKGTDAPINENDDTKPLDGGEVMICAGCITRERKRAARKKVKKVEEEESWHKDEDKRVIVFNTQEIKEWQQPSSQFRSDTHGDRRDPTVPEGAMQVDAPMRIACYCRHQNEKLGFQVIFTIKDCNGCLVAQEVSSSIMITDDHKAHNMPQFLGQSANAVGDQPFLGNPGVFGEAGFDVPMAQFRASHSSSNSQNFHRNHPLLYHMPTALHGSRVSPNASATMTPRSVSRQASPSGSLGTGNKKRKTSVSSKVPSGLAMTRLETTEQQRLGGALASNSGAGAVTPQPPPANNATLGAFASTNDGGFEYASPSGPLNQPSHNAGPPTPNSNERMFLSDNGSRSMDNLAMQQLYSAPASAYPSRTPSPSSLRSSVQAYQQQQVQIARAVANGFYGMPLSLNPHRPPTIHKMIPNEGPKAGGIEVTCLGSGFCQGLEVMFGDMKATTTTYWGETSLVCLLPPAASAGAVAVTFKHQHQPPLPYVTAPIPKQQSLFKYVDDDEQQVIKTALSVLGHKMTGRMEDVRDLARRIVGDGPSSWGSAGEQAPTGSMQQSPMPGFDAAMFGVDVETTLLKILDLIDLDNSPRLPRLNLRRTSGQTMLHLASALGLHRFVAGLLARGANPEPRDKGGYTPTHLAAMHNHPQIVRRLVLSGADPTWRTLQGYTPEDLCASNEVLLEIHSAHRNRRRSGGSSRSRTSSISSLHSLWETSSAQATAMGSAAQEHGVDEDSDTDQSTDQDEDDDAGNPAAPESDAAAGGPVSSATAMTAVRDHFTAQIQSLQQSMQHLNLPQMPNMPDYQAYLPTTRQISSLVPHIGSSKSNDNLSRSSREPDSKWWDLFSGTMSTAPPAYEDIYPQSEVGDKGCSAAQAATSAVAESECATPFPQTKPLVSASDSTATLDIKSKHTILEEQQAQLQLAHAKKVRFRSDRKLFFIWIPILVIIVGAMLYNRLPEVLAEGRQFISTIAV